ncbi:MAG: sodium-dependent transporter [Actinomycetota bacterium]|nr:sodium-dependent transporter [Actinomycetota bacterium]
MAEGQDQTQRGRANEFNRVGFILAAVGSAIGLGNIWRFPYIAYSNGGGAFLIPYVFALLTAGLPLLIMEVVLGHRFRGATPLAFARASRKSEWIGWWQIAISFVVSLYYCVVIAWAMAYTVFAVGLQWGGDTEAFLLGKFLQANVDPGTIGSLVPSVLVPLAIVWTMTLGILFAGIKRGLELAARVFVPTLMVIFFAIVIRGVTLPGATEGLNALFRPDFSGLTDPNVWVQAYAQIFFSLSVGFGIMATFGSYLPRGSDLNNSSAIAAFSNCSFEIIAGIGVFSCLGFLATQQGIGVNQVVEEGVTLAFVIFPQIINTFPGLNSLLGLLFFLSLVVAGLSSHISIVETYVAGMQAKAGWSRRQAVAICGGFAAVISLLFTTQGGLYFLDVSDYFITSFGLVTAGLAEAVAFAWFLRRLDDLRTYTNPLSDFTVGQGWKVAITFVTPPMLAVIIGKTLWDTLQQGYGGYPNLLLGIGWGVLAASLVAGLAFGAKSWSEDRLAMPEEPGTAREATT